MSEVKNLYIMQGIPGSGKSTVANKLAECSPHSVIFSTDNYWYLDDPNVYAYDPAQAYQAHLWNQQQATHAMADGFYETIIIDNTNLTYSAAKPYIVVAEIFEYSWSVIRVDTPLEVCIARQADRTEDRRVPEEVIRDMYSRLQTITAP